MKKNIKTLKDPVTGEPVHPITIADGVYMNNGTRLEDNIRFCVTKSMNIGDLNRLATINKGSIVNAINEIVTQKYGSVYGVRFSGSNTEGERLEDAFGAEVEPHYLTKEGKPVNSFDKLYPWRDIRRCIISNEGDVLVYEGEPGFGTSSKLGSVFVEIPKFYQRIVIDETLNYIEYWISPTKVDGFWLNPVFKDGEDELDYAYIGAYECGLEGERIVSKSSYAQATNLTIDELKSKATAIGDGFDIMSYYHHNILEYLFLIEYANRDAQSIYQGNCASNLAQTGKTDLIKYHSGAMVKGSYSSVFKYRHLENIYGNLEEFIAGVTLKDNCVTLQGANGKVTTSHQLTDVDDKTNPFYVNDVLFSASYPYLTLPKYKSSLPSGSKLYFADTLALPTLGDDNEYCMVSKGTDSSNIHAAGLFSFDMNHDVNYRSANTGARLVFKPKAK